MSMSNFIRWGAIGAISAGVVYIVGGGIVSTPLLTEEGHSWFQQSPLWYWVEFGGAVALLMGLVGLYLYLRRSPRFGWLGTVAFYLLIVLVAYEAILPLMGFASESGARWLDSTFGAPQALGKIFATLLFGIAILRAGTLPRAGAWIMIIAVLVFLGTIVSFIVGANGSITNWSLPVASMLYGLGLVILGYGLWTHRSDPVLPARPAPAT
jgi:hypothetical protein